MNKLSTNAGVNILDLLIYPCKYKIKIDKDISPSIKVKHQALLSKMDLDYKRTLDEKLYLKEQKHVPLDLIDNLNALEHVLRFQFKEYPTGVIVDNTKVHTLKCIHLAKSLDLDLKYPNLLRTLWIHDIPELEASDVTEVERYRNTNVDKTAEQGELHAAKRLLNKADRDLLNTFNNTYEFLKKKTEVIPSLSFLYAKLVDNSEGNMTFHYFISKWVKSESYNTDLLPPPDSLIHPFVTNAKFKQRLKQNIQREDIKHLLEFIDSVINEIKLFWKDVPKSRIPVVITNAIKDYERED